MKDYPFKIILGKIETGGYKNPRNFRMKNNLYGVHIQIDF
jgi:hypothetical protein